MNIIDHILNYAEKERGVIVDESPTNINNNFCADTRKKAGEFASNLDNELRLIKQMNDLLSEPRVIQNKDKHMKLTLAPKSWLAGGNPVSILFCLETTEPICAYFESES